MSDLNGSSVLITGGAMGLGRLLAERVLRGGARVVVLWDVDEMRLRATAADLSDERVRTYVVDVSEPDQIETAARKVRDEVGAIDILFNNAGIVVGRAFAQHSRADIERTMRINTLGVMHVARAFLPDMLARGSGHLVNIASAAGLIPNPNMSVYAASKWAVIGWSESLRLEVEAAGLRVTTFCPSYIDTGMFAGVTAPLLTPILRPDAAVDRIMRAVRKNDVLVLAPFMVNFLPLLRGVLPARVFDFLAGRVFGVYHTMDHFTGRADK